LIEEKTVSGDLVRDILKSENIAGRHYVNDRFLILPPKDWVYSYLYPNYVKWIRKQAPVLKVRDRKKYRYIKEKGDCDNRGFWFLTFASLWNLNNTNPDRHASIFLPAINYRRKSDERYHVINLFIDNSLSLGFIEPGNGRELELNVKERDSIRFVMNF
jgi:hypothetical protein